MAGRFVSILQDVDRLCEQVQDRQIPGGEPASVFEYRSTRRILYQSDRSPARAFWREKLKGFTAPTPLPLDLDAKSRNVSEHYGRVGAALVAVGFEAAASVGHGSRRHAEHRPHGAPGPSSSVATAVKRTSCFGATKTGRRGSAAIGLLLNTLPVRICAGRERTVVEFCKTSAASGWICASSNTSPWWRSRRPANCHPPSAIFKSLVVFEKERFDSVLEAGGRQVALRRFDCWSRPTTPFRSWLAATGRFSSSLPTMPALHPPHDPSASRTMFRTCLSDGGGTDRVARTLEMLSDEERHRILEDWNHTQTDYPRDVLVSGAIAVRAAAAPEARGGDLWTFKDPPTDT